MDYYPNAIYPVSKLLMTARQYEIAVTGRVCVNSCNVTTNNKEHSDTFKTIRRELGELLDYIESTLIAWTEQAAIVPDGRVFCSKAELRIIIIREINIALDLLCRSGEECVLEKWLANPCPVELLIACIYGYTSDVEVTINYLRNLKAQGWVT